MTEFEFEQLVQEIRPELIRIAARRGGRDQADDAVQKTILQIWNAGKWETAPRETVAGWLRNRAKDRGMDELRGLRRLRDAQRNVRVLEDKGCKQTQSKPNADGEETNK